MGFTFFILLLGALIFTLVQKSEAKANREYKAKAVDKAVRKAMGNGRDNIYQFKIYCYNIRCLLTLAKSDGIGTEDEELDEEYYVKYYHEIRKKYCNGQDPVQWCMHKAIDAVIDCHYVNSWIFNEYGTAYYDERDIAHGIHRTLRKNTGTWTACKSEYSRDLDPYEKIEGINLPRDGRTGAEDILRELYSLNHKYDDKAPPFSKSGITLDGIFPIADDVELKRFMDEALKNGVAPNIVDKIVMYQTERIRSIPLSQMEVCHKLSDSEFRNMIRHEDSKVIKRWIDWKESCYIRNPKALAEDPQYIEACVAYLDKKSKEAENRNNKHMSPCSIEQKAVLQIHNYRSKLNDNDPFNASKYLMPDFTLI